MELDQENHAQYIAQNARDIDYRFLANLKPVLFLAETHRENPTRLHIAGNAGDFKKAGVTHYAIEASSLGQPVLDQLKDFPQTDLSETELGPEGGTDYEAAIRAMAYASIKVKAIDYFKGKLSEVEARENHMTESILNMFAENGSAKVAVLVGAIHSRKTGYCTILNTSPLATRLAERGIDSAIARYICADDDFNASFLRAVSQAGLENRPFMVPLEKPMQFLDLGIEATDYIIYLPSNKETHPTFRPPQTEVDDLALFMTRKEELQCYVFKGLLTEEEFQRLSKKLQHEFSDKLFYQDDYHFKNPAEMGKFLVSANLFRKVLIEEEVVHETEHFEEAKRLGVKVFAGVWICKTRDGKGTGFLPYIGMVDSTAENALKATQAPSNPSPFDKHSLNF